MTETAFARGVRLRDSGDLAAAAAAFEEHFTSGGSDEDAEFHERVRVWQNKRAAKIEEAFLPAKRLSGHPVIRAHGTRLDRGNPYVNLLVATFGAVHWAHPPVARTNLAPVEAPIFVVFS